MDKAVKTVWDCRAAQAEISLEAGGDPIDPSTRELLQTHLRDCAACRKFQTQMTASLEVLQTVAAASLPAGPMKSLWPGIAARLPASQPQSAYAKFNLWIPTAAMAAACAAMVLVTVVQIERISPFAPTVSPHLHTMLNGPSSRDLFHADRPGMHDRPREVREFHPLQPTPVSFPTQAPAYSFDREW